MLKNVLTKTGRTKTDKTHRLLGYSFRALIERITKHPNWSKVKDYVWHIDHIFPIKAFTDHGIMDVQLINCLDNLQPMLGKDNCSKNAKYNEANFLTWVTNR
jgi:Uri superfamily endonuclease